MAASPNFTVGSVHHSAPLTNFSLAFRPDGLVAEQVYNLMPVMHENDIYYVWDQAQATRLRASDGSGTMVADGAPAMEENYGATEASYKAESYKLATKITDRMRSNADDVLRLEETYIANIQTKILLEQEVRVATQLTTTGNYTLTSPTNTTTLSGTNQWNNASFASQTTATQSIIKKNIDDGREAIRQQTNGKEANTIIIPAAVARVVARDVGVMDQVKYTASDLLVGGMLPPVLWGLKVIVPHANYTTTVEGGTAAYTDVWGKHVVILYRDPSPGINTLTTGMIFRSRAWMVRQWREEQIEATKYEASVVQTEKFVAQQCAYLIYNAIA